MKKFILKLFFSKIEREIIYCSLSRMSKISGMNETIKEYSYKATLLKALFDTGEECPLEI